MQALEKYEILLFKLWSLSSISASRTETWLWYLVFLCVKMTYNNIVSYRRLAMPTNLVSESARINLRTSTEAKAIIERAAALMGTTVSSFMLQNAYEAARRIVTENNTLLMTSGILRCSPHPLKIHPNRSPLCVN